MREPIPEDMLQLRSLVKRSGEIEISLARIPVPKPGPDEVLIRIEAEAANPTHLSFLTLAGTQSGEFSYDARMPRSRIRVGAVV